MKNGLIIDDNGNKIWYLNDVPHREDGPAVEQKDGINVWYRHGERHREDGPAIEYANGRPIWYLHGYELTEAAYHIELEKLGRPCILSHSHVK